MPRKLSHPIGRMVESVSSARDVGSQFVRENMLAQVVLAAQTAIPD